jgi:predicted dehydrogenase
VLGESAQTLWQALRTGVIGEPRLVYAEMDDGPVFRMPYRHWISESGQPWPYKDEFEVGCTLEHAGYYVTWLTAFFGPATSVTSFAACLYPDKRIEEPLARQSPDYTVASIQFASGVVARLTCGIVAPKDRQLRIMGETGVLSIHDCWDYRATVKLKRMFSVRRKLVTWPIARRLPLVSIAGARRLPRRANRMQFCRGVAEVAGAISDRRASRLPNDYCLHNTELVLAIQSIYPEQAHYRMTTSFKPTLTPMPVRT